MSALVLRQQRQLADYLKAVAGDAGVTPVRVLAEMVRRWEAVRPGEGRATVAELWDLSGCELDQVEASLAVAA